MVRPETTKWGQTLADLRRLSVEAEHARTRERFGARYMIESERANTTQRAAEIGRDNNTLMGWVYMYNKYGTEALSYRRSGGSPPF